LMLLLSCCTSNCRCLHRCPPPPPHRRRRPQTVVDFQWNPEDTWTLASVSDNDGENATLQVWRPSDLLLRPQEEVLAEMEAHRWAAAARQLPGGCPGMGVGVARACG
jgi:hypothetical protein